MAVENVPDASWRRPTMRDVAARAGVSLKTVSRVVNREPGVRTELRHHVHQAIEELGYQPDMRARHLRSLDPSSASIGLIQVDTANPFSSLLYRGVEDVAREEGFVVLSGSSDEDPEQEKELWRTFTERRLDGFVAFPTDSAESLIAGEVRRGIPVVCVDRALDNLICDTVVSDNYGGARSATEHLIAHGHQRIGYLGDGLHIYTARERLRGFQEALDAADLDRDPRLEISGLTTSAAAREAAMRMLTTSRPPTALFTSQNLVTVGAVQELHRMQLEHKVALTSFDDVIFGNELDPGITVVPQDFYAMGRRATRLLFDRLAGKDAPPVLETMPVPLIARGSGEIAPPAV